MRNPLKRLARRDASKPTLRARLAGAKGKLVAVKEKYGRTVRVHRAPNAPVPVVEPVDRVALVNYATWLDFERYRVCAELYPHMGTKATRFTIGLNAAERFFYPENDSKPPPASSRALKVLDLIGIDWREDTGESDRRRYDEGGRADTGERPAVPFGWPALDAELTEALDDLTRLDAAIDGLYSGDPRRDADTAPGYEELETARKATLARLSKIHARGMPGLQAKAHALLTNGVGADYDATGDLAESLARDVISARPNVLDQLRPDPIFAAIEETKRLAAAVDATFTEGPRHGAEPSALIEQRDAATAALWTFFRGKLLKTAPTTAAGCTALAAYARAFLSEQDVDWNDDAPAVLGLIARSPLR